jgi:hypothetical protein
MKSQIRNKQTDPLSAEIEPMPLSRKNNQFDTSGSVEIDSSMSQSFLLTDSTTTELQKRWQENQKLAKIELDEFEKIERELDNIAVTPLLASIDHSISPKTVKCSHRIETESFQVNDFHKSDPDSPLHESYSEEGEEEEDGRDMSSWRAELRDPEPSPRHRDHSDEIEISDEEIYSTKNHTREVFLSRVRSSSPNAASNVDDSHSWEGASLPPHTRSTTARPANNNSAIRPDVSTKDNPLSSSYASVQSSRKSFHGQERSRYTSARVSEEFSSAIGGETDDSQMTSRSKGNAHSSAQRGRAARPLSAGAKSRSIPKKAPDNRSTIGSQGGIVASSDIAEKAKILEEEIETYRFE